MPRIAAPPSQIQKSRHHNTEENRPTDRRFQRLFAFCRENAPKEPLQETKPSCRRCAEKTDASFISESLTMLAGRIFTLRRPSANALSRGSSYQRKQEQSTNIDSSTRSGHVRPFSFFSMNSLYLSLSLSLFCSLDGLSHGTLTTRPALSRSSCRR